MQKLVSPSLILIFSIIAGISCALSSIPSHPPLEDQTWAINPEAPGLYRDYMICTKSILGICLKKEWAKDLIDFTKEAERKSAIDRGIVCRVDRDKP